MRFSLGAVLTAIAGLVPNASALNAQQANCDSPQQTFKICVLEPKQNTRKVYACKAEEYCLPRGGLFSLWRGQCDCSAGPCGDLKVRCRLVVKKVPDCETKQCVPREVRWDRPVPCTAPAPLSVPSTVEAPAGCIVILVQPVNQAAAPR
jgi:hypothetical protein